MGGRTPAAACSKSHTSERLKVSLYKIFFHFTALLWESIILLLPPPLPATPTLWQ